MRRTRTSSWSISKISFLPSVVVRKRTFNHFMSTGATEKSLYWHVCGTQDNKIISMQLQSSQSRMCAESGAGSRPVWSSSLSPEPHSTGQTPPHHTVNWRQNTMAHLCVRYKHVYGSLRATKTHPQLRNKHLTLCLEYGKWRITERVSVMVWLWFKGEYRGLEGC